MSAPVRIAAQDHSEGARKIVIRTPPQYPTIARSMKIQGSVRVDVLVAPNGTVKSVEIKGGHPVLVQSAEIAVREWKWEPSSHETHEIIELKFTLQ
jgi:protein TonB